MADSPEKAIIIGGSAGALEALSVFLPTLPEDFPYPVILIVHLPSDKKSILAELLNEKCALRVIEATDKEPLSTGSVFLAPPDYHLLVELDKTLSLSSEDPVMYSRPSIDVSFETAAEAFGAGLTAVLLTGANSDGAQGLSAICNHGGTALIQDPATAVAAIMPESAIKTCPAAKVLTLDQIGCYLLDIA